MNLHRNPYLLPAPGGAEADPQALARAAALPQRLCPLCRQPVALGIRHDSRCPHCHSPA